MKIDIKRISSETSRRLPKKDSNIKSFSCLKRKLDSLHGKTTGQLLGDARMAPYSKANDSF
jgi:hypothetical protein